MAANWLLGIVSTEKLIFHAILLTIVVIIYQLGIILWVLLDLHIGINHIVTCQSPFNHSANSIQSGSSDGQMTVQRGSNKGQIRVK